MANPFLLPLSSSIILTIFLLDLVPISSLAKLSTNPISEDEISGKMNTCYADIHSGLFGERCRSSMIDKENCALRCASPVCYELIYESDPLEEGERDYIRNQEYRYCMRRISVGLDTDEVKGSLSNMNSDVSSSPSMALPGSVRMVGVKKQR